MVRFGGDGTDHRPFDSGGIHRGQQGGEGSIQARLDSGLHAKAKTGKSTGGRLPFGYQALGQDIVIQPENAPIVVRVFQLHQAGLDLAALRGVTSDGAQGLLAYLRRGLTWVQQQRCVWHLWRNLGAELARASARAAQELAEGLAQQVRQQVRQELTALLHAIIDAPSYEQAEQALARLMAHASGAGLGKKLNEQLDRLFMYQLQPELRSGTIGGSCGSAPSGSGATFDYA